MEAFIVLLSPVFLIAVLILFRKSHKAHPISPPRDLFLGGAATTYGLMILGGAIAIKGFARIGVFEIIYSAAFCVVGVRSALKGRKQAFTQMAETTKAAFSIRCYLGAGIAAALAASPISALLVSVVNPEFGVSPIMMLAAFAISLAFVLLSAVLFRKGRSTTASLTSQPMASSSSVLPGGH